MEHVVLVIHLILALAIIGLVLLQRSEGGGLGIGGGGLGNLATAKGAENMLTRATAIAAAGFFCTSLILGIMAGTHSSQGKSILDSLDQEAPISVEMPSDETLTPDEMPSAPIAE